MRKIDTERFERLVKTAEAVNRSSAKQRFYPIRTVELIGIGARKNKILVFGMYDYKTKKYALSKPFIDVNTTFDEIEDMVTNA